MRDNKVQRVINQRKCSLAKAMENCGLARNTLRGFIGICELKIFDQDKFNTVVSTERKRSGKPSVEDMEQRCRVALSEYRAQSKGFNEEGRLLLSFLKEVLQRKMTLNSLIVERKKSNFISFQLQEMIETQKRFRSVSRFAI